MKINIAYPRNGTVKQFDISDDTLRKTNIYDYRLGNEIDGALFGPQFAGYTFNLKGGQDKQGFPMVQGVLASSRVSLLLKRGAIGFCAFRGRPGERRKKSVRGCIVGPDIACLNVVVTKVGATPIEGVTDVSNPRRLGPKRASKIRKLFNLGREDDVRRFVVRRKVEKEGKKPRVKAPRVQRLITPTVKARRVAKIKAIKAGLAKSQERRREYLQALTQSRKIHRQRKNATLNRRRSAKYKINLAAMKQTGATTKTAKKK